MPSPKCLFVFSLGGSLVVPKEGIDTNFLHAFRQLILTAILKEHQQFVMVVGGGSTCRNYQAAARKISPLDPEDLDWLGIHSTRLNGHLLRTIFRSVAHPVMCKDPTRLPKKWRGSLLVLAGWKPGWSTDYVAVRAAKELGSKCVVNLSNIDYLYDKDPRKYKGAQPIFDISWKDFQKMVGNDWDPGMNTPFDPVASRLAHKQGIEVIIMNGKKIKNLEGFLLKKSFTGTFIHS
ncbi:UMP kinase [Candidatus Uhrbacteria bacterium CG_4_9_14_3_um_filter_36_7]|uniref:UMP kinase n=1 Tax=Candidatus Uhrbacteria bacterium CG_4_9_14_3_um_filter_36_7 TaxID=1975033 RepID=A0A2M7XH46_9BACT|nr:MAG: UMP kinase [Candidatus Uhrbacteria bacterium CG_4_9_14_3_um_filter_36_7]